MKATMKDCMYKERGIMRKVTNDLKVNLIENMGNRIRSFN